MRFWGYILILVAMVSFFVFGREIYQYSQSQDWPSAPGVVIKSGISKKDSGRRGKSSSVYISYSFQVNGTGYTGHRYSFFFDHDDIKNRDSFLAEHQPGKVIKVFYNPEKIEDNAMSLSFPTTFYIRLAIMVIAFIGGVWIFLYDKKKRSRRKKT
ncbi:MAG: hypothetical protein RL095_1027 [Verrucomicrobiota bacterium]|jgi:hypothetical protein